MKIKILFLVFLFVGLLLIANSNIIIGKTKLPPPIPKIPEINPTIEPIIYKTKFFSYLNFASFLDINIIVALKIKKAKPVWRKEMDLVIKKALWKEKEKEIDLLIKSGIIEDILPHQPDKNYDAKNIYNAEGLVILPALIDSHVHLRDPGFEYKEDIESGLKAAAGGGFGKVMAMANTKPVNDNQEVTRYMKEKASSLFPNGPELYPIGALTKGLKGEELAEFDELLSAGCVALSNDGVPVKNNGLFRKAVEYAYDVGLKVIDHCEDVYLSENAVANEGKVADLLGLKGQPSVSEALQVARDILLAGYLNIPIHLAHISCRESVELIYFAKKKGIPITAETCPHYLLWDESLILEYNTLAKVNPPLRTKDDVIALRQAVREGIIDTIATDHAPHAKYEKETTFEEALFGISGLDTALSLTWGLIKQNEMTVDDLIRTWVIRPAEIFSLPYCELKKGDPADFILFDPEKKWLVTEESMLSKGKNTPCLGQELIGKVKATFLKGTLVFEEMN